MWFKNLSIFRLTEAFTLSSEELEQKLESMSFRSCGPHEEFAFGWTSPLGKTSQQLTHNANGF
ncbi:MAG: recombination-associated protein RdgC, partial [Methylobacter sp.]